VLPTRQVIVAVVLLLVDVHLDATLKNLKRVAAQLLKAAKLLNAKARAEAAPKIVRVTVRGYTKIWIEGRKTSRFDQPNSDRGCVREPWSA
jgi:hypothetical protein